MEQVQRLSLIEKTHRYLSGYRIYIHTTYTSHASTKLETRV